MTVEQPNFSNSSEQLANNPESLKSPEAKLWWDKAQYANLNYPKDTWIWKQVDSLNWKMNASNWDWSTAGWDLAKIVTWGLFS